MVIMTICSTSVTVLLKATVKVNNYRVYVIAEGNILVSILRTSEKRGP